MLRRYIHKVGVKVIDDSLNCDTIPQLLTIQKGLLALTRQWKNSLYMPTLADNNFKNKKKAPQYTVTFKIPQEESIEDFKTLDDGDITLDNFEVVDEKTSLLRAEGGSMIGLVPDSIHSYPAPQEAAATPAVAVRSERPASISHIPMPGVEAKPIRKGASAELIQGEKTPGAWLSGARTPFRLNLRLI